MCVTNGLVATIAMLAPSFHSPFYSTFIKPAPPPNLHCPPRPAQRRPFPPHDARQNLKKRLKAHQSASRPALKPQKPFHIVQHRSTPPPNALRVLRAFAVTSTSSSLTPPQSPPPSRSTALPSPRSSRRCLMRRTEPRRSHWLQPPARVGSTDHKPAAGSARTFPYTLRPARR